ncbi:hypothetical protein ACT7DN_01790 [Bacillus paranthracis]
MDAIKSINTNALMRHALETTSPYAFSREGVQEYKNKIDKQDKIRRIFLKETPIRAFKQVLELKEISFSENSRYTAQEWYSYCNEKLALAERSPKAMKNLIRDYVDCTEHLSNLTKEKELYSFTSNEINLKLFNHSVFVAKQVHLYTFLKEFHAKLVVYLNKKRRTKKDI